MKGIDEGDDLAPRKDDGGGVVPVYCSGGREGEGRLAIVGEEELERRAEAGDLHLAPEAALVAADAVHDARDVAEVLLEFGLEDL